VRALCRAGVPKDAWALAGLPVGGYAHLRAQDNWSVLWAATVLRRAVQRLAQRLRGAGSGAVVDMVRARRVVRAALSMGMLLVGDTDSTAAIVSATGRRHAPPLSIPAGAELIVTSACTFTPRTLASLTAVEVSARSLAVRHAFPFLRAAGALMTASREAPYGMPLHVLSGSSRSSVAAGGRSPARRPSMAGTGAVGIAGGGMGGGAVSGGSSATRMLASSSGGRGAGLTGGTSSAPGGLAMALPIGVPLSMFATAAGATAPPLVTARSQRDGYDSSRAPMGGGGSGSGPLPSLAEEDGDAWTGAAATARSRRLSPIRRPSAMPPSSSGATIPGVASAAAVSPRAGQQRLRTAGGGGGGFGSGGDAVPYGTPAPATARVGSTPAGPLHLGPLSAPMPLHPLFRQGALPPLREGDIASSPAGEVEVEARRRASIPTAIMTARSARPESPEAAAAAAAAAAMGETLARSRPGTVGSTSSGEGGGKRGDSREGGGRSAGGRRPSLAYAAKTTQVAVSAIPALDLRSRRHSQVEAEAAAAAAAAAAAGGGAVAAGSSGSGGGTSHRPSSAAMRTARGSGVAGMGRRRSIGGASAMSDLPGPVPGVKLQSVKEVEGVAAYTLWSPTRLVKLLLALPTEDATKGMYLRSTPMNVTFPDAADGVPGLTQGQPQWVSLRRAREVVRLLLLSHEQEEAMEALRSMAEWGVPAQYAGAVDKWPKHIVKLLDVTGRVDRDSLAALLVTIRERSRLEFAEELATDFASFDPLKLGMMQTADFCAAVRTLFPHLFSQPQLEALYDRGRVLESRLQAAAGVAGDDDETAAAAGGGGVRGGVSDWFTDGDAGSLPIRHWGASMWVDHMLELSDNLLR
jgi:hypothetical protein